MIRRSGALGVVCIVAASALAQSTFDLAFKPTVAEKQRYQIKMQAQNINTGQGEMAFGVTLVIRNEVKEVTETEIGYESVTESIKVSFNGTEIDPPGMDQAMKPIAYRLSRRGELIRRDAAATGGMSTPMRFEHMISFTYPEGPVKPGDSWTREIKADPASQVVAARAKFTFEGVETVRSMRTFKVSVAYSELEGQRPMGMIGTAWFDPANGSVVQVKANMNDVSLNPMMPPANMTFEMVRL